jgi:hypothetical protein
MTFVLFCHAGEAGIQNAIEIPDPRRATPDYDPVCPE